MQNRVEPYLSNESRVSGKMQRVEPTATAPNRLEKILLPIEQGLGKYPVLTIGAGLAIGALVGWFIKRK